MNKYSWEWHFFKGLTFGYPLCCVLFYCSAWSAFGDQRNSMYTHLTENGDPYTLEWENEGKYIVCPECIIKQVTMVIYP